MQCVSVRRPLHIARLQSRCEACTHPSPPRPPLAPVNFSEHAIYKRSPNLLPPPHGNICHMFLIKSASKDEPNVEPDIQEQNAATHVQHKSRRWGGVSSHQVFTSNTNIPTVPEPDDTCALGLLSRARRDLDGHIYIISDDVAVNKTHPSSTSWTVPAEVFYYQILSIWMYLQKSSHKPKKKKVTNSNVWWM